VRLSSVGPAPYADAAISPRAPHRLLPGVHRRISRAHRRPSRGDRALEGVDVLEGRNVGASIVRRDGRGRESDDDDAERAFHKSAPRLAVKLTVYNSRKSQKLVESKSDVERRVSLRKHVTLYGHQVHHRGAAGSGGYDA